jgi:hypothetical protein
MLQFYRYVCFAPVACQLVFVFADIHFINCEQGVCNKVYVLPDEV